MLIMGKTIHVWGQGVCGISLPFSQFGCELETDLKKTDCFLQKGYSSNINIKNKIETNDGRIKEISKVATTSLDKKQKKPVLRQW